MTALMLRAQIAQELTELALRLDATLVTWPLSALTEQPRAACEEASAILADAATEIMQDRPNV